jgi:hypothetical protein
MLTAHSRVGGGYETVHVGSGGGGDDEYSMNKLHSWAEARSRNENTIALLHRATNSTQACRTLRAFLVRKIRCSLKLPLYLFLEATARVTLSMGQHEMMMVQDRHPALEWICQATELTAHV